MLFLETILRGATKTLLTLAMVLFGAGGIIQFMLLFTRLGGITIIILAAFATAIALTVLASTLIGKRTHHTQPVGLPPIRRWIVDPNTHGGLREATAKRAGER